LNRGDVVILENLSSHKSEATKAILKERGAWFVCLTKGRAFHSYFGSMRGISVMSIAHGSPEPHHSCRTGGSAARCFSAPTRSE